jgi:hypothetical protein
VSLHYYYLCGRMAVATTTTTTMMTIAMTEIAEFTIAMQAKRRVASVEW